MLGVSQFRSASIKAETICSMWEITQEQALTILDRFPDAQKHFGDLIVKHLERTAPSRVSSLPLFRAFDSKFRMLLGLYCERHAYFPGQIVAKEGGIGNKMFIVNVGIATLKKKGLVIKTYGSGSHFGSTVMLGIHKTYLGTLVVLQTCHMLSIPRTSYQQALEKYPSIHAAQELIRTERVAADELREAILRISTRKLIWKRYQNLITEGMTVGGENVAVKTDGEDQGSNSEFIMMLFQQWHQCAKEKHQKREKNERER